MGRAIALILVVGFAAPGIARAQCRGDARVTLEFAGEWPEGDRGEVTAELRAALQVQGFALCLENADSLEGRVARLVLQTSAERARIEVRDDVTDKRVQRDLDLSGFPEDARPLAIAIASDELLRASWAELMLVDAPPPAREPPEAVRALVRRETRRVVETQEARLPRYLDLAGALEYFGGGDLHVGGDLHLEVWLHPRVAIGLDVGARSRITDEVALGSIRAVVLAAGAQLWVGLVGQAEQGWHLVAGAGLRGGWIRFDGTASPTAVANAGGAGIASLRLALEMRHAWGPVRLRFGALLGAPLRSTAATADGVRVGGTDGVELGGILALGMRL